MIDRRAYADLKYLPPSHSLRNTLLIDLGVEFKHAQWPEFKPLERGKPLADNTYNTLSRGWQDFYVWRIPAGHVPPMSGATPRESL